MDNESTTSRHRVARPTWGNQSPRIAFHWGQSKRHLMTIVPSCVSDERVQRLILESSTASWSLNHCRPLIVKPCKTRLHFKWVALLITAWTSTVVQTLVTTQVRSRHYSVHIPGHLFGFFVGSFLSSAHPHLLRLFKPIYFPFCIILVYFTHTS